MKLYQNHEQYWTIPTIPGIILSNYATKIILNHTVPYRTIPNPYRTIPNHAEPYWTILEPYSEPYRTIPNYEPYRTIPNHTGTIPYHTEPKLNHTEPYRVDAWVSSRAGGGCGMPGLAATILPAAIGALAAGRWWRAGTVRCRDWVRPVHLSRTGSLVRETVIYRYIQNKRDIFYFPKSQRS
jgi:hypothetical protein